MFKASIQFDLDFVTGKRSLFIDHPFDAPRTGLHTVGDILIDFW